jgi:hypothetical protein
VFRFWNTPPVTAEPKDISEVVLSALSLLSPSRACDVIHVADSPLPVDSSQNVQVLSLKEPGNGNRHVDNTWKHSTIHVAGLETSEHSSLSSRQGEVMIGGKINWTYIGCFEWWFELWQLSIAKEAKENLNLINLVCLLIPFCVMS